MTKLLQEIHPGEILLEDFMKPMGISARQLAADIDVSPSRVSELVNGQRPITTDTALRLGLFFSMEPRFWLNLQSEYDYTNTDARVDEVRDWTNRTWRYSYDTAGNLISARNPLVQAMTYSYHLGSHWLKAVQKPMTRDGKRVQMSF